MDNQYWNEQTAALRTKRLVGRDIQLQAMHQAIADAGRSYVLYFYGKGGMGKTRLLEEVGRIQQELEDDDDSFSLIWSKIIDLYHSDFHSVTGIEQEIIRCLDPKQQYFNNYRRDYEQFTHQRQMGLPGAALEEARKSLTEAFVHDYARLAKGHRVVLTFDTLELAQYESDNVQELCQIEDESSFVRNWFLDQIPQLPNTVTFFASRPREGLQAQFEQRFKVNDVVFQHYSVEPLDQTEIHAYLDALTEVQPDLRSTIETHVRPQVGQLDEIRPIYLSLLVDFHYYHLDKIWTDTPNKEGIDKWIAERLLLYLPEPYFTIMNYLAFARKGLDFALFDHLEERSWSEIEIKQAFAEMCRYTFIKCREMPGGYIRLFLHDELYDLFDRYQNTLGVSDPTFVLRLLERLRDYYRIQQQEAQRRLELQLLGEVPVKQLDSSEHPKAGIPKRFMEEKLLRELEDATVTLLHYELRVDPTYGYYRGYVHWDEEAIKSHRTDYDMRLRDEVLRFLELYESGSNRKVVDHQAIDRDCAVRWLRRYLIRGAFKKAYEVAERVRYTQQRGFKWQEIGEEVEGRLYKAGLLTTWAEAMLYGAGPESETNAVQLEAVVMPDILELLGAAVLYLEPEPQTFDEEKDEPWRWARTLGRAYNNIGFAYRLNNQLSSAVEPYRKAIALYRRVDVRDEMADTVNNLAYVYAKLGAIDEAEALADDALALRHEMRQRYQLGFSYNTRGAVCNAADQPHRARALCQEAYKLFTSPDEVHQDVGHRRGQALTQLSLGEAFRGLGNLYGYVYERDDSHAHFTHGRDALRNAVSFFESLPEDPYALDVQAELGRLYRDWMRMYQHYKEEHNAGERQDLAEGYLNRALHLARQRQRRDAEADILEDLARLYVVKEDKAATKYYLDQAKACIPEEYKPKPGHGFTHVEKPVNMFWLTLGKIYLLEANLIFDSELARGPLTADQEQNMIHSMEHRLLAVACFEQYSPYSAGSPGMKKTRRAIYDSLKKYSEARLQRVFQEVERVAEKYNINLDPIKAYMQETLGIYTSLVSQ